MIRLYIIVKTSIVRYSRSGYSQTSVTFLMGVVFFTPNNPLNTETKQ